MRKKIEENELYIKLKNHKATIPVLIISGLLLVLALILGISFYTGKKELLEITESTSDSATSEMMGEMEALMSYLGNLDETVTYNQAALESVADYSKLFQRKANTIKSSSQEIMSIINEYLECEENVDEGVKETLLTILAELENIYNDVDHSEEDFFKLLEEYKTADTERQAEIEKELQSFFEKLSKDSERLEKCYQSLTEKIESLSGKEEFKEALEFLEDVKSRLDRLLHEKMGSFMEMLEESKVNMALQLEQGIQDLKSEMESLQQGIDNSRVSLEELLAVMSTTDAANMESITKEFSGVKAAIATLNADFNQAHQEVKKLLKELTEDMEDLFEEQNDYLEETFAENEEKLEQSFLDQTTHLDEEMAAHNEKLDQNFLDQTTHLDEEMAAHNEKLDQNFLDQTTHLDEEMTAHNEKLDQNFLDQTTHLDEKMTAHNEKLDQNFLDQTMHLDEEMTAHNEKLDQNFLDQTMHLDEEMAVHNEKMEQSFSEQTDYLEQSYEQLIHLLEQMDLEMTGLLEEQFTEMFSTLTEMENTYLSTMEEYHVKTTNNLNSMNTHISKQFENMDTSISNQYESLTNIVNVGDDGLKTYLESMYGDLKAQLNQVFTFVSNGKKLLASALLTKGVSCEEDATFQEIYQNILAIQQTLVIGVEQIPGTIEYDYHYHADGAGNLPHVNTVAVAQMGGCYTTPVYHAHTGSSSGGGGCYSVAHTGYNTIGCGGGDAINGPHGPDTSGNYYWVGNCNNCGGAVSNYGGPGWAACGNTTTVPYTYYTLGCGLSTSSIVGYSPSCGLADGQMVGAHIVYEPAYASGYNGPLISTMSLRPLEVEILPEPEPEIHQTTIPETNSTTVSGNELLPPSESEDEISEEQNIVEPGEEPKETTVEEAVTEPEEGETKEDEKIESEKEEMTPEESMEEFPAVEESDVEPDSVSGNDIS